VSEFKIFETVKKIDELKENLHYVIMEEASEHEKDFLNKKQFKEFITPVCEKIVKETGINSFNILKESNKKALTESIEKHLLPKMETYLRERCKKYQNRLNLKIEKLIEEFVSSVPKEKLNKAYILNMAEVYSEYSKDSALAISRGIGANMGVTVAGAIGAAISSAFLTTTVTTTYLWIFTATATVLNPVGWSIMIVSALVALFAGGKIAFSDISDKLADILGPSRNMIMPNGTLYKIWHEGLENNDKKTKTESMKSDRQKDFDRIWNGYKSFKNPVTGETVPEFEGIKSIVERLID
jgi:hypothetical protein